MAGMFTAFSDNVPGLGVVLGTFLTASVLLGAMQLISGFGLIWIQNWARWLCAFWGILEIATIVFILGYLIAVVSPSMPAVMKDMERWAEKIEEKQRQKGFNPGPRQRFNNAGGSGNPVADNIVAIAFHAALDGLRCHGIHLHGSTPDWQSDCPLSRRR